MGGGRRSSSGGGREDAPARVLLRRRSVMNATESLPYTVDYLNGLLRGEIAAVETYEQALPKVQGEPMAAEARRVREDHRVAVEAWQAEVRRAGGWPSGSSDLS